MSESESNKIINYLLTQIHELEQQKAAALKIVENSEKKIQLKKQQVEALNLVKHLLDGKYDTPEIEIGFGRGKRLPEETRIRMQESQKLRQEKKRAMIVQEIIKYLQTTDNNEGELIDIANKVNLTTFFTKKHLQNEENHFVEVRKDVWKLK